MELTDRLLASERLINWIESRLDGLQVASDDRTRLAVGCLDVALEHHKAIVLLISRSLYGSAFALVRLIFEAYVRGVWINSCASCAELERYKAEGIKKSFGQLAQDVEALHGYSVGVLSAAKTAGWNRMNSFTHSGYSQASRRHTPDSIEPNYPKEEILEALNFADAIALLAMLAISIVVGNGSLMQDVLEKSSEVACEP